MSFFWSLIPRHGFAAAVAAFGLAAAFGRFQFSFPTGTGLGVLLAVPFGVGFTAAVVLGRRAAWPVAAGAAVAVVLAGGSWSAAGSAAGIAAVEVLAAAAWCRRVPFAPGFDSPADVLKFFLGVALAAAARGVATAAGAAALGIPEPAACGAAAGLIAAFTNGVMAPAVVVWACGTRDPRRATATHVLECGTALALAGLAAGYGFAGPTAGPLALSVPMFAAATVLSMWLTLRYDVRGVAMLVWVVGGVVTAGAAARGTFHPVLPAGGSAWDRAEILAGLAAVAGFQLVVAAGVRRNRLRDRNLAYDLRAVSASVSRTKELNERLSLQALEIADQAAELQLQRDGFEQVGRELADRRAWLESVLAQLPVGIMLVDPRGGVTLRNPRFDAMLGIPPGAAVENLSDFANTKVETPAGERLPYADWPLVKALRDGEASHGVEMRVGRADGTPADMAVNAAPIRGAGGAALGAVLALTDMAPVRRAEARLRLLESAVVHARDAIVVLEARPSGAVGRAVLYVNEAFVEITGYSSAEVVGRSLHFLRGPRTDPATLEKLRVALDAGTGFKEELLNYSKDGSEVWMDVSLVPVAGPDGACAHFVMIQRDVTARKHTEEALRRSEALFRGMFEGTAAGVSMTDATGVFVQCNPAFVALLGRTSEEILNRRPADFTHPDDIDNQAPFIRDLLAGTRDGYQIRKRYLRPDGGVVWTELSVTAVRGPAGDLIYGMGVTVDVTGRLALEEQLRQAQKMEALGQLAGGIAHDFNNLLTAVLGNLALVRLAADDPNRPLLRTVEQASARAAELTRKLLGYARRNQIMVAPVAAADVFDEVVDILRRTLDPRITITTAVRTAAAALADATLVNQALFNLCLNARDAMPGGGRLTLEAEFADVDEDAAAAHPDARPGAYVKMTVADTGHGMPDGVIDRLFEPFFTTKEVGRGTGLGLAMVHGIMRQHGGWVEVASAVGAGTRFTLYLPAADPAAVPAPRPAPVEPADTADDADDAPPAAAGTVLLVDDELMIRDLARAVLESAGFTVIEAEDGVEAVDAFRAGHAEIDLVILDLTMPRMSGRDAFRGMIAIDPAARVLFSSGYSADDLSEVEGAKGLLSKPYRPPDLIAAVRRAMADAPAAVGAGW